VTLALEGEDNIAALLVTTTTAAWLGARRWTVWMPGLLSAILLLIPDLPSAGETEGLSPCALAASPDGKTIFVACAGGRLLCFDASARKVVRAISMPAPPLGLAISTNGARLYVTAAGPESRVCIVDVAKRKIIGRVVAGHTAMAPVLSKDGSTLYVCNRFDNDVGVIDLTPELLT